MPNKTLFSLCKTLEFRYVLFMPNSSLKPFLVRGRAEQFFAIQNCLLPRSKKFGPEQKKESLKLVNELLSERPDSDLRKLALFFKVINLLSFWVGFHSFRYLQAEQQRKVMGFLFDNPVPIIRKGFWGLNTLAKLSVYGQKSLYKEIGYELRETPRT